MRKANRFKKFWGWLTKSRQAEEASPAQQSSLTLTADLENLNPFQDFVRECVDKFNVSGPWTLKLELVLEEALVNVMSYAYPDGNGDVEVICRAAMEENGNMFSVTIKDQGIPYDPLQRDDPDIDLPLEERPIGGLGVKLMREMSDDLRYESLDGNNVMSFAFLLGESQEEDEEAMPE